MCGTVRNLGIENVDYSSGIGWPRAGSFARSLGRSSDENGIGIIENCYAKNVKFTSSYSGDPSGFTPMYGGLVGNTVHGTISNSYVTYVSFEVNVDGKPRAGFTTLLTPQNPININNCYVAETSGESAGFMNFESSSHITVNNNYTTSSVSEGGATIVQPDVLKGHASNLGSQYIADASNINDGYPALKWQYIENKELQNPPEPPKLEIITSTSVTLMAAPNQQYSKNGVTWQFSPIFTGLDPGSTYTFFARFIQSVTHEESVLSKGAKITLPLVDWPEVGIMPQEEVVNNDYTFIDGSKADNKMLLKTDEFEYTGAEVWKTYGAEGEYKYDNGLESEIVGMKIEQDKAFIYQSISVGELQTLGTGVYRMSAKAKLLEEQVGSVLDSNSGISIALRGKYTALDDNEGEPEENSILERDIVSFNLKLEEWEKWYKATQHFELDDSIFSYNEQGREYALDGLVICLGSDNFSLFLGISDREDDNYAYMHIDDLVLTKCDYKINKPDFLITYVQNDDIRTAMPVQEGQEIFLHFNDDLNPSTVSNESITMNDEKGKQVSIEVDIINSDTVKLTLPRLEHSNKYIINLHNKLKSKQDKSMADTKFSLITLDELVLENSNMSTNNQMANINITLSNNLCKEKRYVVIVGAYDRNNLLKSNIYYKAFTGVPNTDNTIEITNMLLPDNYNNEEHKILVYIWEAFDYARPVLNKIEL